MMNLWDNVGKRIAVAGGVIAILSTVFGLFFWADNRYASGADLKKLEDRLEYKITGDQQKSVQERIWKLEDRYNKSMPPEVKDEYRKLKENNNTLKLRLNEMEKKGVQ
jgi:hypothetical protein